MAQMVKNLPAVREMQEAQARSLGQEDPRKGKWQPAPVFLPGKSHGQRSLVGYSPWVYKESDMTVRWRTGGMALTPSSQVHLVQAMSGSLSRL